MSERGTVFQTTQVGLEVTPGTVIAAYKRLLAVSIEPKPMVPTVAQRNEGSKFVNSTFNKKEYTQADVKGEACFQTLPYLLGSILTAANPVTPGGGTNSRLWTYQPNTYAPDSPSTFTVESGSSAGAERFPFGVLDSLALRYTKDEVGVSGTMFGQALVESITLTPNLYDVWTCTLGGPSAGTFTLTYSGQTTAGIAFNATSTTVQTALNALSSVPSTGQFVVTGSGGGPYTITASGTSTGPLTITGSGAGLTGGTFSMVHATPGVAVTDITPVIIDPTMMEVWVSADGISYTQLNRCFEAEFSINNRFAQIMTLDDSKTSFSAIVEKAPELSATLIMEHDTVAAGYMADLRAKNTKYCRILATGAVIETSLHYLLQIDFPFHFKDNSRGDKESVWSSTYHLQPVYQAGWNGGAALKIQVQNTLTAL